MRQTLFTRASFTRISQSIYDHSTFTSPVWFLYPVSQPRHEVWECADTDRCHFWHHHWHEVGLVSVVPPEYYSMIGLVSKCDFCECVLILVVCPSARVDQAGVICKQEGIFRVNCMDCLDRTNVVQAAIARVVMEQQVWFSGFFLFMITYILEILIIKKKKGHNHYKYQGLHFMCAFLPAAEEIGCDASRAASASQVLQDLSGHVGKQRWHHQQTVRWHSSSQGILIVWGLG